MISRPQYPRREKQINPSNNAHLLRSALILLSLVTFNRDIFCQTPTPTGTPSPSATPTPILLFCGCCEAESGDNTQTGSATIENCPTCSGGQKVGYVGNNSGTLQFNGVAGHPSGRSVVTIYYTNGDAVRYALLSVNGGQGIPLSFPSTGSFQTVGSIQTTITTNPGSSNTLEFYNPIVGSWAPDFDRLGVNCPAPTPTPCNVIVNGGFETGTFPPWVVDNSNPAPFVASSPTYPVHSGNFSGHVGSLPGGETPGDSSFYQQIAVPAGGGTLSFWYWTRTVDTITFDWQDAYITDTSGAILQTIFHECTTHDWMNRTVDMAAYAGMTVRVKFLAHGDNFGDPTDMFVDDVQLLLACASPTPIPTPTPTPTPTATPASAARAIVADFSGDGHPDWVLRNASQTAIWYMNNNVFIGGAFGPTLVTGWGLKGASDFDGDGHPDCPLFKPSTLQTAIWYLSGPTPIYGAYGPTLPSGWTFVITTDLNGDGKPDYVLHDAGTRQTAIWYMNNNVLVNAAYGPSLPAGWSLMGMADFNGDGHPDYVLVNSATRQTAIWYLSGPTLIGAAYGPTIPTGWALVATADFNGDGKPDYLLYNAGTRQTAIWYMNNNVFVSPAYGPTLPAGWSLVGQ